jgi:hypothetical protein
MKGAITADKKRHALQVLKKMNLDPDKLDRFIAEKGPFTTLPDWASGSMREMPSVSISAASE